MTFNSADFDGENPPDVPPLANAELVQLQIRVIALENLVIAMLADAPGRQFDLIREKAIHILPRPGFTSHRLTIAAAAEMNSLAERAIRFSAGPSAGGG